MWHCAAACMWNCIIRFKSVGATEMHVPDSNLDARTVGHLYLTIVIEQVLGLSAVYKGKACPCAPKKGLSTCAKELMPGCLDRRRWRSTSTVPWFPGPSGGNTAGASKPKPVLEQSPQHSVDHAVCRMCVCRGVERALRLVAADTSLSEFWPSFNESWRAVAGSPSRVLLPGPRAWH